MKVKLRNLLCDKPFYKTVLAIAMPIIIQNAITNFVNMLDNIMVGRLSTEAMSGVSIVNQYVFIFNLAIFGGLAAAGIYTAQYFGLGDDEGVRHTFRYKIIISIIVGVVGVLLFVFFGHHFIDNFLHDGSVEGDLELTRTLGQEYLNIMVIGFIPFAFACSYASTYRETNETVLPMTASLIAVGTNFVLNYILIFGKLGIKPMGVVGAAVATVVSRYLELAILVIYPFFKKEKFAFLKGAFKSLRIPFSLSKVITIKGLPLLLNELFWSYSVTKRNQCYSIRGLDAVAAQNISATVSNLFNVVFLSFGTVTAIVIGNLLGAGKIDEAKDKDKKLLFLSVAGSIIMAILLAAVSPFFPLIYNTTDTVRAIATEMIIIQSIIMPFIAIANTSYFTLRSGGKVFITILFDCGFMWGLVIPLAYILSHFTSIPIVPLFAICNCCEILKGFLGLILVKKVRWANNLVGKDTDKKIIVQASD